MPNEFQEVEWIGSSGTQYIIVEPQNRTSPYSPFTTDDSFNIKLSVIDSGDRTSAFGVVNYAELYISHLTIQARFYIRGDRVTLTEDTPIEYEFYVNGDFNLRYNPLRLFTYNGGSYSLTGKIYYFKWTRGTDTYKELIPCYRKSDNEIGMYDLVYKEFYTNQGTGTFTKGPEVWN